MSDVLEFGFDDGNTVKSNGIDKFKQSRAGEKSRVSVVSFKKYADIKIAAMARERGSALNDAEKAEIISKVDAKLKERLGKAELTEADRLDITKPRFGLSWTHYIEENQIGTIRCLSTYQGSNITKKEKCCDKTEAEQTVAVPVMVYPVDNDLQVDMDDFRKWKVRFEVWKLTAKKFPKLERAYKNAKTDGREIIDLLVELDGDPKYQKQNIGFIGSAAWAREDVEPELRQRVLEAGLRAWKGVDSQLGFKMSKEKLHEKLGLGSAAAAVGDAPKLSSVSYDSLL